MKKIVVITGCSKQDGVGFNLAVSLLKRGHHVIATVRNLKTNDLNQSEYAQSENLDIQFLDLCQADSIQRFIDYILEKYQYVDVLVNNAADVTIGPIEAVTQQNLQTTFQTKVFGPVELIQGFVPSMRQRGGGLLITTSSIFCARPFTTPGIGVYLGALNAFECIQQNLAIELAKDHIHVVNYQPGPIRTQLTKHTGSRAEVIAKHYESYIENAYQWYANQVGYQTAKEVAEPMADIIEMLTNKDLIF